VGASTALVWISLNGESAYENFFIRGFSTVGATSRGLWF
jgi:hypothetical protein